MSSFHSKHSKCRLCESTLISAVLPLSPVPLGEHYSTEPTPEAPRYPIDLYQCHECGAVQTNDDIDPSFLWKDYTYFSGQTGGIERHFAEFANFVLKKYAHLQHPKVLDIGSNDGTLLKKFKQLGCIVQGIDPAETVVSSAVKAGIPTLHALFNFDSAKTLGRCGEFQLITAFNVFAHSAEMHSMAKGISYLLSKDGIFCFEVQYLLDISQKNILGTIFHEHMVHYSLSSARKFLADYDLEVIDFQRNNIQNGSIIIFAAHKDFVSRNLSLLSSSVDRQIYAELSSGILTSTWAHSFYSTISNIRRQCEKLLGSYDSIVAYGAARSGPTLAIQYGLDHRIKCLFDDHPSKIGKYSPFNSLLVLPTSRLNASDHPLCVILAYIHSKSIIARHRDYLLQGGRFLILWPKFDIVDSSSMSFYT